MRVEHVQNFGRYPLTRPTRKAPYIQLYLSGNQRATLANKSVGMIRSIMVGISAPPGVGADVTGPAPVAADQQAGARAGTPSFGDRRRRLANTAIGLPLGRLYVSG